MECITDVYGFAAKVEMALVSKLGADMNPVAARFNIIVVEIAKNMELVRSWSGIVRRATADPTARLTQLEEFKLMTSFVQRYCRAFVEKQSEVVHNGVCDQCLNSCRRLECAVRFWRTSGCRVRTVCPAARRSSAHRLWVDHVARLAG
jgi:hypothetical protein